MMRKNPESSFIFLKAAVSRFRNTSFITSVWLAGVLWVLPFSEIRAQSIGINTTGAAPSGDAALDVDFSDKGVLIPRVSLTNTGTYGLVGGPSVNSMLVYNTNNSITGTGAFGRGFYYWNSTLNRWVRLADVGTPPDPWYINGNYQTTESNFVGTTDGQAFNFRVANTRAGRIGNGGNTFLGFHSGSVSHGTSLWNVALGYEALSTSNWWTSQNIVAVGYRALYSTTTAAGHSVAIGREANRNKEGGVNISIGTAAHYNTGPNNQRDGNYNIAIGDSSMYYSDCNWCQSNIGIGRETLYGLTQYSVYAPIQNLAIGIRALRHCSTTGNNIGIGREAMFTKTHWLSGSDIAIGTRALYNQNSLPWSWSSNSVIGDSCVFNSTTGFHNTALGRKALFGLQGSIRNTALGNEAMELVAPGWTDHNVAVGWRALRRLNGNSSTPSNENVALGANAGTSPTPRFISNSVFIGADSYVDADRTNVALFGYGITDAQCTGNNQVLLGNTAVTQIRAQVTGITTYSDARFKQNVAEDVKGLDFILALRPVSYQTDPEVLHRIWGTPDSVVRRIDHSQAKQTRFSGFIAQEVEAAARKAGFAFPGMDVPRNEKEVYSLRYTDFIVPLVKAVQERQQVLDRLAREYEALTGEITELEARVQHQKTANRRYEAELHAIRNAPGQNLFHNPGHQIKSTTQK